MSNLLSSLKLMGTLQGGSLAFIVLAAAAVFAFSYGIFVVVTSATDPLRRRLERVAQRQAPAPTLGTRLAARVRPLASLILPKRDGERSRVSQLLLHAGYRSTTALSTYYGVKAMLITALPVCVAIFWLFYPKMSTGHLLYYMIAAAVVGFLIPSVWLDKRVLHRQRALRAGFPDALDLLVVCVEAGLGLAPALQRVADEIVVSHPELGGELALVNAEMRAGVERAQSLKDLAERTGLPDIRGLVALLVQTMRFGTSIADALRVYAEEFRDKRTQAAEEAAAKIATKMIFPLVFCLFPSFFLIAIGPAVLRLITVFEGMSHHVH